MTRPQRALPAASWWGRNRIGLLLLLPALAAAVAAASFRMVIGYGTFTYWRAHDPVGFVQPFSLDGTDYLRTISVALVSQEQLDFPSGSVRPPGTSLVRVDVRYEAPPTSPLLGCDIRLADTAGRTFRPIGSVRDGAASPTADCVPGDTPGPDSTGLDLTDGTIARPGEWSGAYLFLLPDDADPVALRLGWNPPDYVVLPLR